MFARVARFEGLNVATAAQTIDEVRRRREPLMRGLPGYQGHLDLVDRSSGKAVTIAFFDTEQNMIAAERTFDEEMPKRLGHLVGTWAGDRTAGHRTAVERYEVVADSR
jgi:hypothetical protein